MPDDALPRGLQDLARLSQMAQHLLDAPIDLPLAGLAMSGLTESILALYPRFEGSAVIAERMSEAYVFIAPRVAQGATVLALGGRTGKHLLYALAVNIGRTAALGEALDPTVLELVGAHYLIRLLKETQPSPQALAKAGAALCRPLSSAAQHWPLTARLHSHMAAMKKLEQAIALNPTAAAEYGLIDGSKQAGFAKADPTAAFNAAFRCRMRMLREFASLLEQAGAGGHGTLPADALRSAGRELLGAAEAGDVDMMMVCLEIVSHLSSALVARLPVQTGDKPPAGTLAWLDVPGGAYCHVLYDLVAKGARPEPGTEHLYEKTIQVVRVLLTPLLTQRLQAAAAASATTPDNLQQLLGAAVHKPYARVAGQGAYRVTARRAADSVPPVLLAQGHNRWPIATATSSPYLVPQGRPFYGACRSEDVDAVAAATCTAMDWPTPEHAQQPALLGSFVTPTPAAVCALLNHHARQADRACDLRSFTGIVRRLNVHSAWLAALWALCFALRDWLCYALPGDQLRAGQAVKFDEKGLHAAGAAAVPIASLVQQTLLAWDQLVEEACTALLALDDEPSRALLAHIKIWVSDPRRAPPVFAVDAARELQPVGHLTWRAELPAHVRLVLNFGRHFWPLQLLNRKVPQLLVEVLMRHQQEGLHPGSSHRTEVRAEELARLKAVIDEVISGLPLCVPQALKGVQP